MEPIRLKDLVEAVNGRLVGTFQNHDLLISKVDIDSREIREGSLFVPIVGERFDGHDYIESALENGAAGCLSAVEPKNCRDDKFYILVSDTTKALQDFAKYYKNLFDLICIGITGSVGKTTTKDMIAAVLSEKFPLIKTEGNFNNEIGLPLTLFNLSRESRIAVLEMGMSAFGEIDCLGAIVEPDIAVITNVGDAHIEFLGSRENILKAKSEIFTHLKPNGFAVLNADDPLLWTVSGTIPQDIIWCGASENADYRAGEVQGDRDDSIRFGLRGPDGMAKELEVPALGSHMIYPVSMAAAIGQRLGMTMEEISHGISRFSPTKMRMNILHRNNGITILDDGYNANPQSMRAAVEVLSRTGSEYKVAVLGDMFELGSLAPTLHEGIGEYVGKAGIDCVVAIGDLAEHIASAASRALVSEVYHFATKEEAFPILCKLVRSQTVFLVKASRGMHFEKVTEYLLSITGE